MKAWLTGIGGLVAGVLSGGLAVSFTAPVPPPDPTPPSYRATLAAAAETLVAHPLRAECWSQEDVEADTIDTNVHFVEFDFVFAPRRFAPVNKVLFIVRDGRLMEGRFFPGCGWAPAIHFSTVKPSPVTGRP